MLARGSALALGTHALLARRRTLQQLRLHCQLPAARGLGGHEGRLLRLPPEAHARVVGEGVAVDGRGGPCGHRRVRQSLCTLRRLHAARVWAGAVRSTGASPGVLDPTDKAVNVPTEASML